MRRTPGWQHRQEGDRARDDRAWGRAARAYAAFLESNPVDWQIWVQYGHALREGGEFAAAERAYRRAVDLAPDAPDPIFQLAITMLHLQLRDRAIAYLLRSAVLGNNAAIVELERLGVAYDPQAKSLAPWIDELMIERLLVDAQAERDLHRWDRAERLYLQFIEYRPDSRQARRELESLLELRGESARRTPSA